MVDDEETVRRGFETRIDWAGEGFEFLPPCENGREAIEAIDSLHPDVVLTDICMPFADGISVAAHVQKKHPHIVVVVLSGFDEFRYAQEAIRHDVFDYILKPVTARDLTSLLQRVKGKLDSDSVGKAPPMAHHDLPATSGSPAAPDALAAFLGSAVEGSGLHAPEELFGFDPGRQAVAVIFADTGKSPEDIQGPLNRSLGTARHVVGFALSRNQGGALVFEKEAGRCAKQAEFFAASLLAELGQPAWVGVGRSCDDWRGAPRSFEEAQAALAFRLVKSGSGPFRYPVESVDDRTAAAEMALRAERICFSLRNGSLDRTLELGSAFLEALGSSGISPLRIQHEIQSLFTRGLDALAELGISRTVVSGELGGEYYEYVRALDSPAAILGAIRRLSEISLRVKTNRSLNQPEWKILDFKEYVERHYSEPNLWIRNAAEGLAISESYLSKILRRYLDCSFVEYLAGFRIERSRSLLETTDLMTYEVASAVGYSDPGYFCSVFKKLTGLTPTDYRATIRRDPGLEPRTAGAAGFGSEPGAE